MMNRKGTIWIILGLLLIAAALFLTAYNMYDDQRAGQSVMQAIDQLGDSLLPETPKETATEPSGEREAPAIYDQTTLPDYVLCPEMILWQNENNYSNQLSIRSCFSGIDLSAQKAWKHSELTGSIFLLRIIMMILLIPFFISILRRYGKSI